MKVSSVVAVTTHTDYDFLFINIFVRPAFFVNTEMRLKNTGIRKLKPRFKIQSDSRWQMNKVKN